MAKYNIDIPEEFVDELKDSFFETEAYKDIIAEIAVRDADCNNETMKSIISLYKEALIRYTKVKADLELDFIYKNYPTVNSWTATFGDNKLEITTAD